MGNWEHNERRQAGFSLLELILVMAITASLMLVAFVGQRALRSQAQFNGAVDKIVSTVAEAHSEAAAGVNIVGTGDGTAGCGGLGSGQYVFAGVSWTADNSLAAGLLRIDYYEANPGVAACVFDSRSVSLPAGMQVNATNPPATQGGRVLFVRGSDGGVMACTAADLSTDVVGVFAAGSCTAGSLTLTFEDGDGHSSQVTIDQSGLAKRDN